MENLKTVLLHQKLWLYKMPDQRWYILRGALCFLMDDPNPTKLKDKFKQFKDYVLDPAESRRWPAIPPEYAHGLETSRPHLMRFISADNFLLFIHNEPEALELLFPSKDQAFWDNIRQKLLLHLSPLTCTTCKDEVALETRTCALHEAELDVREDEIYLCVECYENHYSPLITCSMHEEEEQEEEEEEEEEEESSEWSLDTLMTATQKEQLKTLILEEALRLVKREADKLEAMVKKRQKK